MTISAFKTFEKWEMKSISKLAIIFLMMGYGITALGSPMPSKITHIEIIAGVFLLLGGMLSIPALILEASRSSLLMGAIISGACLFFMPLWIGLSSENELQNILRDIFSLVFLVGVPLLLCVHVFQLGSSTLEKILLIVIVLCGVISGVMIVFGVYTILGSLTDSVNMIRRGFAGLQLAPTIATPLPYDASPSTLKDQVEQLEFFFLKIYDPALLFTSIYFCVVGISTVIRSKVSSFKGIMMISAGGVLAYLFMIMGLRAYAVSIVLAVICICILNIKKQGLYTRVAPLVILFVVFFHDKIQAIIDLLRAKQNAVGSNGKIEEFGAVLHKISPNYDTLLLGVGWGGLLENPIFLGSQTRFTHSMLSFYLLKSGVLGLLLLFLTFYLLFFYLKNNYEKPQDLTGTQLEILIAATPPLLIGVFFQPTYKMLSYGIIVTLLILVLAQFKCNKYEILCKKIAV